MRESPHSTHYKHLRQQILSHCTWSEPYSSLKHILRRKNDQLPLLISFADTDDGEESSTDDVHQPILFFDRSISKKLLFTPLRQVEDQENRFEVYPQHCTFATTDLFKGLVEFVLGGQRSTKIFSNPKQLVSFASEHKCPVVFMSRDRVECHHLDASSSQWSTKKYPQGAFFQGQRIHQPLEASHNRRKGDDVYLECLDEEGLSVFLKMKQPGRYSLIATMPEQQTTHPEWFLHSTQAANIAQLIKSMTLQTSHDGDCVRLVRGSVPHNFHCQHLRLVREHTHDVLVGLTQEDLIVEWNLDSHALCRYATNLEDILSQLSSTWEEQLLESYIDQARTNYRDRFQHDVQLISTRDWTAFFQYWKWTGDVTAVREQQKTIPYQSRHRFHLVASLQDLSDEAAILARQFRKNADPHRRLSSHSIESQPISTHRALTSTQQAFISEMSRLLSASPRGRKRHRKTLARPLATKLFATQSDQPFDDSVYESNQHSQSNRAGLIKHNSH